MSYTKLGLAAFAGVAAAYGLNKGGRRADKVVAHWRDRETGDTWVLLPGWYGRDSSEWSYKGTPVFLANANYSPGYEPEVRWHISPNAPIGLSEAQGAIRHFGLVPAAEVEEARDARERDARGQSARGRRAKEDYGHFTVTQYYKEREPTHWSSWGYLIRFKEQVDWDMDKTSPRHDKALGVTERIEVWRSLPDGRSEKVYSRSAEKGRSARGRRARSTTPLSVKEAIREASAGWEGEIPLQGEGGVYLGDRYNEHPFVSAGRDEAFGDTFGSSYLRRDHRDLTRVREKLEALETGMMSNSPEWDLGYKYEAKRLIAAAGGKQRLSLADWEAWDASHPLLPPGSYWDTTSGKLVWTPKQGSSARGRRAKGSVVGDEWVFAQIYTDWNQKWQRGSVRVISTADEAATIPLAGLTERNQTVTYDPRNDAWYEMAPGNFQKKQRAGTLPAPFGAKKGRSARGRSLR